MTVRDLLEVLKDCDPDAVVVVAWPRTGEDDEPFPYKLAEEVNGDCLFRVDPSDSNYGSVGSEGERKCVSIW